MKKKPATTTTLSTPTPSSPDLKSIIRIHSEFFDNLVSLIPSNIYITDADSKPYIKGLSKSARASLKQQTRENIKLARRNRHNPEKIAQLSTLQLLKQSLIEPGQEIDNDEDSINTPDETEVVGSEASTYEELRLRLRKKIEALRGNRGGEKSLKKDREGEGERKRKRTNDNDNDAIVDGEKGEGGGRVNVDEIVEKGIEFGKVKLGDEEKGNRKKKRKMPKAKELERVQRLEEMKRENPVVAKKESWKAATSRAYGAKVHDDPKLLKESIKKQKRKTVKSAEKWKERVERTNKLKNDKQQKRSGNIAERAKDKKARKIAKREKKLMRPGFEGRKEGYITKT